MRPIAHDRAVGDRAITTPQSTPVPFGRIARDRAVADGGVAFDAGDPAASTVLAAPAVVVSRIVRNRAASDGGVAVVPAVDPAAIE